MRFPRFLLNLIAGALPPTRLFEFKRCLYRAAGAEMAPGVKINSHCSIIGAGRVSVGADSWIGIGTKFIVPSPAEICIGENCDIAPDVCFLCGTHELGDSRRRAGVGRVASIEIGPGVWIGARATVLPGAVVGGGSMIAAGSVVLAGVYPANALLAGNPAQVRKTYAE